MYMILYLEISDPGRNLKVTQFSSSILVLRKLIGRKLNDLSKVEQSCRTELRWHLDALI